MTEPAREPVTPIDIETEGPTAPPRRNGEIAFEAPWQARAFGICLALLEREGLEWNDFRPHLVTAIAADPEREYYDSFAVALDDFSATTLGLSAE